LSAMKPLEHAASPQQRSTRTKLIRVPRQSTSDSRASLSILQIEDFYIHSPKVQNIRQSLVVGLQVKYKAMLEATSWLRMGQLSKQMFVMGSGIKSSSLSSAIRCCRDTKIRYLVVAVGSRGQTPRRLVASHFWSCW
jgi:hypothetical protein